MKKLISIIIAVALILSPVASAEAKPHHDDKHHNQNTCEDNKQTFKIKESPVIKYGKYKLPLNPVVKGMGAQVTFDKSTAILTVTKDNITIVINFKKKTVTVNGVQDCKSGIFTAHNSRKTIVLISYIAKMLGVRCSFDDDDVIIVVPGFNQPTNVTVTPAGTVVIADTLNTTSTHLTATANINPGQATGGRAELYVGSKLVAVDQSIAATDNSVTFTTSDGSPTNAELQALIPSGGLVTVKLYNTSGSSTASTTGNPTLKVDYIAPTLYSISSASYNAGNGQLTINVTGAGANGDLIDVTKLSLYDSALNRSYQLTNNSSGTVSNANTLVVNLGSVDKAALTGYGSSTLYLSVAPGSLLKDVAGNTSPAFLSAQFITLYVTNTPTGLTAPTNITLAPVGTVLVNNTLNTTTLYLSATAKITPGQATGGRAELYVGSKLVATDTMIAAADNLVSFTTSDTTPTNAELQALIPSGGLVTVKLYNVYNNSGISTSCNPTLAVDYSAPTLSSLISASYNPANGQLSIAAAGAGAVGDKVDVTKLTLVDYTKGKSYQLTYNSTFGSIGTVQSSASLLVKLSDADRIAVSGFSGSTVYLSVGTGSLLSDAAGNASPYITTAYLIPVTGFSTTVPPQTLNAPTKVTVSSVGTTFVANALNATSLYMDASATITAGQAAGGKAELYVGNKLIALDSYISLTDTTVTFTTSDGSPTNAELKSLIPSGGVVAVKLYNANGTSVTSSDGNPTLIVDYAAPTLTGISSAIYDVTNGQLYLIVTGAGAVGDQVDVTKIMLYDSTLNKNYQLTNYTGMATTGTVSSEVSILIKLGTLDKAGLAGFGSTTVYLTVNSGSLLKDAAGNTSPVSGPYTYLPVTVIK